MRSPKRKRIARLALGLAVLSVLIARPATAQTNECANVDGVIAALQLSGSAAARGINTPEDAQKFIAAVEAGDINLSAGVKTAVLNQKAQVLKCVAQRAGGAAPPVQPPVAPVVAPNPPAGERIDAPQALPEQRPNSAGSSGQAGTAPGGPIQQPGNPAGGAQGQPAGATSQGAGAQGQGAQGQGTSASTGGTSGTTAAVDEVLKSTLWRLLGRLDSGTTPTSGPGLGLRTSDGVEVLDAQTKQYRRARDGERVTDVRLQPGKAATLDWDAEAPTSTVVGDSVVIIKPGESPKPSWTAVGDVPSPGVTVEGQARISLWEAVKAAAKGVWFTVIDPGNGVSQSALDLAIYLRASTTEQSGLLNTRVRADVNTQVGVLPGKTGDDIVLPYGRIEVTAAPVPSRALLGQARLDAQLEAAGWPKATVQTPEVSVQHRETSFSVERSEVDGHGRTTISVREGSVAVRDRATGKERIIKAGKTEVFTAQGENRGSDSLPVLIGLGLLVLGVLIAGVIGIHRRRRAT